MYDEILSILYDKYYLKFSDHSPVTSSHWRKIGSHSVMKGSDDWQVHGGGFGNFLNDCIKNRVVHSPELFLSQKLLNQYQCPDRIVNAGKKIAAVQNRLCEFDCVKQMLSLSVIARGLEIDFSIGNPFVKKGIRVACVIGDGYGYFTSLLKIIDPGLKIISINLGRTLFFDVLYAKKVLPNEEAELIDREHHKNNLVSMNFCEAEQFELLCDIPIDLFINIASMQEMDPIIVHLYFDYMRKSNSNAVYFYCCNREMKTLPDGTVSKFSDYPWGETQVILDELCPWYQKFPISLPPFWKSFDGPTRHRFVRIK